MKITCFHYIYRDENNYKEGSDFYALGEITDEQKKRLQATLDEGLYFVPGDVGLDHLGELRWSRFPTSADHPFHELDTEGISVEEADEDMWNRGDYPTLIADDDTVEDVIKAFEAIKRDYLEPVDDGFDYSSAQEWDEVEED